MLDILFRNGRILDGSGSPWFSADLGIKDGKISLVRNRIESEATDTVDLSGNILCPGFVDTHTHSDLRLFAHPEEAEKLYQGITTALLGQDGLSVAPLDDPNKKPMMQRVSGLLGTYLETWPWNTMAEYLAAVEARSSAVNTAMLAPHGAIRAMVVGWGNRPATSEEISNMKSLLAESLSQGACGLSTGLIYPPGMYADRAELVELCKTTGEHGGFFVVHMRNEGDYLLDSIREVGGICLDANCPLHISHLKVAGKKNWGNAVLALGLIESFRERGLEVTFDQYPYIAGSTMLDALIPPRFHAGGTVHLLEELKKTAIRNDIRKIQAETAGEHWENWIASCGWEGIMINSVKTEKNKFIEGKTISRIAEQIRKDPLDVVCDLLIEENNAVTMTQFYGCEDDLKEIMKSPYMMLCSDAIIGGKPHPRAFGSTARFLGKYVRDEKVMPLGEAIRKMTYSPCRRMGLMDRGLIREGMVADITVFNPDIIIDKGTFTEPCQHPVGIEYVLVGGVFTLREGRPTGAMPGKTLGKIQIQKAGTPVKRQRGD